MIRWLTTTPEEHVLRDILRMRDVNKMTFAVIAEQIGQPRHQTVRSWYNLARKLLKDEPHAPS